jgi:predicted component of type VI protein secretion system
MLVDVFIQSEDGQTRQERFEGSSQITLGRHTQCTLILDSDLVSRHHATMMFGLEAFRVEDTSSNGTVVGDVVLRHEALDVPYGTPLVVGNYTMQVFPALAGVSVEAPALRTGAHAAALAAMARAARPSAERRRRRARLARRDLKTPREPRARPRSP